MSNTADAQLKAAIIQQARDLGAATAGIADIGALRAAPSYAALDKSPPVAPLRTAGGFCCRAYDALAPLLACA